MTQKAPRATVTLLLIGLFSGAFIAELFFLNAENIEIVGLVPSTVTAAMTLAHPTGLVMAALSMLSSMFVHGSLSHLLGNSLVLFMVGKPVEQNLGSRLTALIYFGGGLFAAIVYVVSQASSSIPMIGGSGGIAALMAVYFGMLVAGQAGDNRKWRIIYGALVLGWFLLNVYNQYLEDTFQQQTWVAYWINSAGFVAGLFLSMTVLGAVKIARSQSVAQSP